MFWNLLRYFVQIYTQEPVTVEILSRLYTGLHLENRLKSKNDLCLFNRFSGSLRSSELLSIKISDIMFNSS